MKKPEDWSRLEGSKVLWPLVYHLAAQAFCLLHYCLIVASIVYTSHWWPCTFFSEGPRDTQGSGFDLSRLTLEYLRYTLFLALVALHCGRSKLILEYTT